MNNIKKVFVTALPNVAPAGTAITVSGMGSTLPIAIGRAVDKVFADKRVKGKRIVLPMKLIITQGEGPASE